VRETAGCSSSAFRLIARDVQEMFSYETGAVLEQKPPLQLVLEEGEYQRTGLPH
jgi:hypothetical protein